MKTLACRLCFVLPLAVFAVFVALIVLGIVANAVSGAELFLCNVYCKVGVGLFAVAITVAILTQVTAWIHESSHSKPPHLPA